MPDKIMKFLTSQRQLKQNQGRYRKKFLVDQCVSNVQSECLGGDLALCTAFRSLNKNILELKPSYLPAVNHKTNISITDQRKQNLLRNCGYIE